jgi:hypothetical protein
VRRALAGLAVLATLGFGLAHVLGDEHEVSNHVLSDETEAGDWATFLVTTSFDSADDLAPALPSRIGLTFRVKEVHEHAFEIQTETIPHHAHSWEGRRIHRGSKKLSELLGIDGSNERITDLQKGNDKIEVQGKTFACEKVTFKTRSSELVQDCTLWLGRDFHGPRIVRLETHVAEGPKPWVRVQMELRGFGNARTLLWGVEPEKVK